MDIPVEVGKTLTVTDPDTGEVITVRLVAAENGKATIVVDAPHGTPVTHEREPQPPATIH